MAYIPPIPDQVNAANSTATPLTSGSVFTGTSVDLTTLPVATIHVEVFASPELGTLQIQFSQNNVNFDHSITATVTASQPANATSDVLARYFRVVYTNGSVNQATFRLQTTLSATPGISTLKDLGTPVTSSDVSAVSRAIATGKNPQGTYVTGAFDVSGNAGVFFAGAAGDAFGRGRVSTPQTLFNASFEYDTQPLITQTVVVGTGAASKTANQSSVTLTTGGNTSTNGVDFQSKGYYRYEPGKSLLVLMTGVIGAAKANVRSQIGFFDANNGLFFDQNNGMGVTVRTNTSGSPVDTTVLQANWNVDKMDGTGISGVTLDFTKAQIFVIDLQWLGVGSIRFAVQVNGRLLGCHQVNNANIIGALPYMNTAALPAHWAIHNTGTASGATTMTAVCCSIVSEGGADRPQAYSFAASNAGTLVAGIGGTRTPLVSIRPKTTFNSITNRSRIALSDFDIFDNSAPAAFWELVYNGTLTGSPSFNSVDANSGVNFDVAATGCTGGTVVASGYVTGGGKTNTTVASNLKIPFTLDAAGTTPDTLTLCAIAVSSTIAAGGALRWTEER